MNNVVQRCLFLGGCVAFLVGAVALPAGCRGPRAARIQPPVLLTTMPSAPTHMPQRAERTAWAEVAYVNEAQGYVVLRAKVLQNANGEATVRRGTNEVARLRVGGPARPPWLTADILSGHPQPRDRVEMKW